MRHFQPYIRHFVAVAEELHFRRAAERLHIAQPVLSRAVQQLEERVGAVLLQRSRRYVALTAAGRLFLEECRAAQRIMERAERRAAQAHLGERGQLVIGYTDFAINGRLPSILAAFHEALPAVDIDLVRRDSHEQLEDLASKRLDMGFLTGAVNGKELQHCCVHQTPFVAVLPANHRLAALDAVPVKALAGESFVLGEIHQWRHLVPQIQALCLQAGFMPKVAREAPNSDSIFGLVAAGMGITLYPDCYLNYDRPGIVIRPLSDCDTKLTTEMAWLKSSTNPAVYRFVEITKQLLG